MPRGDFGIDLRAFSTKFEADLKKANAAYQKWTKGLTTGAKKAAAPVGKLERDIQSLAARIKATNSVAARFALQFRKDLLNLSNIFVRRFTFTIATSLEQMMLRVFRLPVDILKQVIKVGTEFEDAVLKTAAVTAGGVEGLAQAFDQVSYAARQLGRESVFTAVEISKAMFELASVGLDVDEQFLAIQASANFAAAAQTDLMTATNLLTQIMKAYGLTGDDLARVSDVLTFAFNTTTINVERLVEAMKFAAPAGAAFGVDFEETVAVIAGFVDVTKQGGISGRAFRFMLAALGKPSNAALEAIEALGLVLKDVDPRFTSLSKIMENFARSGLNASDAMVIFGKRAGPVVMSFIKSFRIGLAFGINDLEKFKEGINLGENVDLARKQAEIFRRSITNQFKLLVSKSTDLLIRLFFEFRDTFQGMLDLGVRVIDKLDDKLDGLGVAAAGLEERLKLVAAAVVGVGAVGAVKGVTSLGSAVGGVAVGATGARLATMGFKRQFLLFAASVRTAMPRFFGLTKWLAGKGGITGVFIFLIDVLADASKATGGVGRVFSNLGITIGSLAGAVGSLTGAYGLFVGMVSDLVQRTISSQLQFMFELKASVLDLAAVITTTFPNGIGGMFKDMDPAILREQAEAARQFAGTLQTNLVSMRAQLAIREQLAEQEQERVKREKSRRAAAQAEITNMEVFEQKQIALMIGFQNLRAEGGTLEEAMNVLGDEIKTVGVWSENTGNAMFTWFEFLPEGQKRIEDGTVALEILSGQTKDTAISFRDFLNKQMGIFSKIVILPRDTLNRIEEAYNTLVIISKEYSGEIHSQMVKNVRETMSAHIREIQKVRPLTKKELDELTALYKTFPPRLAAPFQEGEEIIFAFATDASKLLEDIPDKVDKKEVKEKSRDIFNSISREFGRAIADMLVDAKGFVDAMTRLMKGLFTDTMFNLFTDFTSVFKNKLDENGKEIENSGLKGLEGLKAGWEKFSDGLTEGNGVFNSVLTGFSAMSGSITSIAFAGFNAILQFMEGNWVAGIISVAGMVVGIFKDMFGKTTVEEAAKGLQRMLVGMGKVSLDTAKDVEELARELAAAREKGAKFAAIAASLGTILEEMGIRTVGNFTRATQEMVFALQRAQQGLIDEKFAIKGVSEAFPILLENLDKMGTQGAANLRRIIELTREMGLEIDAVTAHVDAMTSLGADGINAMAGSVETLTDGQLAALRMSFDLLAVEMLANGASIIDVIEKFGPIFEALGAQFDDDGVLIRGAIDLGGHFTTIAGLAEKLEDETLRGIVDQMVGWEQIMEAVVGLGLVTEDTYTRLGDAVVDSFQSLLDHGLTMEEALLVSAGSLAELIALADKYGFELSEAVQEIIAAADENGILLEQEDTLLSVMKDIRDVLSDMRDILAGVGRTGTRAFDDIRDAGLRAGEDIEDFWGSIGLDPRVDYGGHVPEYAQGGVVPPTPSGSLIARVHQNEIIGAPEQIVSAVQSALGRMGQGAGSGGDVVYSPTIEVRLGRRLLRQSVKEVMERGTLDGDIAVNSESVFFFN